MKNKPSNFRDRLLDSQPITPELREEYRRELDSILNHRLTPRSRLAFWGGMIVALVFIVLCFRSLTSDRATTDSMVVAGAVAVASILFAVWSVRALRQGGFSRSSSFAVTEVLGSIVTGTVVSATLLTGMAKPSDPASTYWTLWGLMLLIVGFAWGTGNRISAARLDTREQLLRLESRLADLSDRLRLPAND
jgi:hypothetical protein